MRKWIALIIIHLFIIPCLYSSGHTITKRICNIQLRDTAELYRIVKVKDIPSLKGLQTLSALDIKGNTLFLINKNKLTKIDINTGHELRSDPKANLALSRLSMPNVPFQNLMVDSSGYYFTALNKVFFLGKNGQIKKIYQNSFFISTIQKNGDRFIIADKEGLKLINKIGNVLSTFTFNLSDRYFIKNLSGVDYQGSDLENIEQFTISKSSNIQRKSIPPPLKSFNIPNLTLAFITNRHFLYFDYYKRDALYILDTSWKGKKVLQKLNLKFNCTPEKNLISAEEGDANFEVLASDASCYITALKGDQLIIIRATLDLI